MKDSKPKINKWKILLCASIMINVILVGIVLIGEKQGHAFGMALERRNIITLKDKSHSDYWARMGWTNSIKNLHTEFDIAFFGNSITRGSDFQMAFPDKTIINLGYSGDNILGMIRRVPMIQASNAKKVFIMAGTNDLVHINLDEYKTRYSNLLESIQNSIPDIQIYIESVLPSNHELAKKSADNSKIRKANDIAKLLAEQHNCQFIDLYSIYANENDELPKEMTPDGVHLYSQYYEKWAEEIKPFVYE